MNHQNEQTVVLVSVGELVSILTWPEQGIEPGHNDSLTCLPLVCLTPNDRHPELFFIQKNVFHDKSSAIHRQMPVLTYQFADSEKAKKCKVKAARKSFASYVFPHTKGSRVAICCSRARVTGYRASSRVFDLAHPSSSFLTTKESVGSLQLHSLCLALIPARYVRMVEYALPDNDNVGCPVPDAEIVRGSFPE